MVATPHASETEQASPIPIEPPPSVAAGVSLAMQLGGLAARRTEAGVLANGKLEEVMATGAWQSGDADGDFGDEWEAFTWALTIADWEEPQIREVTVAVQFTSAGKQHVVSVATLGYSGGL